MDNNLKVFTAWMNMRNVFKKRVRNFTLFYYLSS